MTILVFLNLGNMKNIKFYEVLNFMKKILSILLFASMLFLSTCNVFAAPKRCNIQYLENGDYIVISEVYHNTGTARTTTSNTKTYTYYTKDNTAIFSAILSATFDYAYGIRSSAISSNIRVQIKNSVAALKSKNSYVSGNTAYGTATVLYQGSNKTLNINMSCDIYGNIS